MTADSANAWRCLVCGYVHRGAEPPEDCPICGADADDFEPYEEDEIIHEQEIPTRRWRCTVCNYEHEGDEPPDECPVCGADKDLFEAIQDKDEEPAMEPETDSTVVVVGGGIAGVSAVEAICKRTAKIRVVLISKEADLPYYRLNLSRLLAGEIEASDLPLHPERWYKEKNVELWTGAEVVEISRDKHEVRLRDGRTVTYTKLVLTAGAHPFMPPFPGIRRGNVFAIRTLTDVQNILERVNSETRVAIIGGGILGLEAAGALAKRGAAVTLLEAFAYLMPRQLNAEAAKRMETFVRGLGIDLRANAKTKELPGDENVGSVLLEDGTEVPADLVIVATGIRSNSYLARKADLEVNQGVVVDDYLSTSDPDILAAGDVAEHRGIVYGLWNAAQYEGGIAGLNAAGGRTQFGGIPRSNTLKVLGLDMFSIGEFNPDDGSYIIVNGDLEDHFYHFVFHDEKLVGAILLGETGLSSVLKKTLENQKNLGKLLNNNPQLADVIGYFRKL